jgi:endonuclease YncB( thermonuclease family)
VPAPPLAGAIAPVPTKPRIKTAWPWDARLPNAEAGADADRNRAPSGPRLNGRAIVTAALELNVAGKPLRLAGVTLPITTDLCAPNAGYAARSCADVTRQALAARVGPKGEVSCQILGGGSSAWPAVCQDRAGQDLGAYLIAHGFALADDSDMIDYSAVETQARAARSGLWSYR